MQFDKPLENLTRESILRDYRIAYQSRQASVIGRKEVLTGKAKFGIFGDGKEVAQLAMARAFQPGDFRSGYYRDQTFMFAMEMTTVKEFFAQLYADIDVQHDPHSAGRSMNAHFATRLLAPDGSWRSQVASPNTTGDVSPTGSQMPRVVGLAYASTLYRHIPELKDFSSFSRGGAEIAFGTIGNASTAEGMFWESINALGVLHAPAVISIWDDGYGISVPNEFQMCKGNISEILRGFQRDAGETEGFDIYTAPGWDYPALCQTYLNAAQVVRTEQVPAIIHVIEMTQPQGHSTSGSHERYKSKERLAWEEEYDCIRKMREWMIAQGIATAQELDRFEEEDRKLVRQIQREAWEEYRAPIDADTKTFLSLLREAAGQSPAKERLEAIAAGLARLQAPFRRDALRAAVEALVVTRGEQNPAAERLAAWKKEKETELTKAYSTHLYSETGESALRIAPVPAEYGEATTLVNGFEVLTACFDAALTRYPNLIAMGEDLGKLGDVNQGFAGLQEKYGVLRVTDTGIRECTIIGQAIGMALRGLRPIAEIQYLDYVLYALQIISDDLATLRWRTAGGQKAPVIIRTRGHRLEGIWHAGSPMSGILNLVRGLWVCVPRNMTQAAGMYNTLLRSDDPALVVEVLNAYRAKERLPRNVAEIAVPLGVPEVLREGTDITIVTYGACCRIALEAADLLSEAGAKAEVIDVQTLAPFDISGRIVESIRKTSRVLFVDEDVPGGATAYMLQQVLERQNGYEWLDSRPRTLPGTEHRPAYGSDGDYFSKPNRESIFETAYEILREAEPGRFPALG